MRLCSIASGSSGNCIYVGSDNTHLLVDVGISGKRVEQGLNSLELTGKDIDGILITHEHSDHIKGLGVIARKHQIPVYATEGTVEALSHMNLGKMPEGIFREIHEDEPFEINDLTVNPFTIPHDAAQPVGYRVECGEHSVGIATDLGKYNEYIVGNLQNLDALLLEANHDIRMLQVGKYPYYLKQRILGDRGHLSNENAGRLLCRLLHDNMKGIFLGHLSRENNYEELAYETVCSEVTLGDNPYKSRDFRIQVAQRDCISEGIIAKVCTYLADNNVNILDISQTIVQGYFNMMMVTDASKCEKDNGVLAKELEALGDKIGVVIRCQHEDIFNVMHRI